MISYLVLISLQFAHAKVDLAKLQKDLCAEKPFATSANTEAEGFCPECIYGTQGSPSLPKGMKDVEFKLKLQEYQTKLDREELSFYKLIESRNFFNTISETNVDVEFVEYHLKTLISNRQKQAQEYESLKTKAKAKIIWQEQSDSFKESGKAPSEYLAKVKRTLAGNLERETSSLETLSKNVSSLKSALKGSKDPSSISSYKNMLKEEQEAYKQQQQTVANYKKAVANFGKNKGTITDHATLEAIEDYEIEAFQTVPDLEDLGNIEDTIKAFDLDIKKWQDKLETQKKKEALDLKTAGALNASEIEKLKEYRQKTKEKISTERDGFVSCGMSAAELVAVSFYTGTGYGFLNEGIWKGGQDAVRVEAYKKVLNRALAKLKPFRGSVLRGASLPANVVAEHIPGSIVTYSAFTSTSLKEGFGGEHQFVIYSKTGRYIGPYSENSQEEEVLFPAGTRFKVLEKQDNNFVIEEVSPP